MPAPARVARALGERAPNVDRAVAKGQGRGAKGAAPSHSEEGNGPDMAKASETRTITDGRPARAPQSAKDQKGGSKLKSGQNTDRPVWEASVISKRARRKRDAVARTVLAAAPASSRYLSNAGKAAPPARSR